MNTTSLSERREAAFVRAPQAVQDFYASPEGGAILLKIAKDNGIDRMSDTYTGYALTAGDVALGLKSIDDLPKLLVERTNLSIEEARRLTAALRPILSALPKLDPTANITKKTEEQLDSAEKEPVTEQPTATAQTDKASAAPPSTSADDIRPLRTMSDDMRVFGYGAFREKYPNDNDEKAIAGTSQDELLRQGGG